MLIIQTKSPIELLDYLESETYKDLPFELWDENLFLYNKLLKLISLSVTDEIINQCLLYKLYNDDEIKGIACYDKNDKHLYFISEELDYLKELIVYLKHNGLLTDTIQVIHDSIANVLMSEPHFHLIEGYKRLFTNRKCATELKLPITIQRLTHENKDLLWNGVTKAMDLGWNYYGGFIDEELICYAGLARISKYRSQIIAVKTILESNRNKGFSTYLCGYLLNEALKQTNLVTWNCTYDNYASFKTAQKLGMKHYISHYSFRYTE